MSSLAMLSTAEDEAQGCIGLASGASELARGLRSVTGASNTVRIMNTAEAPNTHCGQFRSMIQPNSSGLTIPPRVKPVVTIPNARPAAPGGAASRTSMSREGAITPPRNPAVVIAAISSSEGKLIAAMTNTMAALTAKQTAATCPWRRGGAAGEQPAHTTNAPAPRDD